MGTERYVEQVRAFADEMDRLGDQTVAAVLGFTGDIDHPEDLAELMIDAFDGLSEADAEQALLKLAMQRGI